MRNEHYILAAIADAGGLWVSRKQIAGFLFKRNLTPDDLRALARLVAGGQIQVSQRPKRGTFEWTYRSLF